MNRKNLVLTMAALLGLLFLAATCGVALASPIFYVKIDNRTDHPVRITWHFSTRNGSLVTKNKVTSIAPHTTQRFWGPQGYGRMVYSYDTGGIIKKQYMDGDTNPKALNAYCYIAYNKQGYLRVYKPNG